MAKEQQIKIQEEKDKLEAAIKEKKEEEKPIVEEPSAFVANATKDVALKIESRNGSGCVTKEEVKPKEDDTKSKKQETEVLPVDSDKTTGIVHLYSTNAFPQSNNGLECLFLT